MAVSVLDPIGGEGITVPCCGTYKYMTYTAYPGLSTHQGTIEGVKAIEAGEAIEDDRDVAVSLGC